jgi:hypothetical protein
LTSLSVKAAPPAPRRPWPFGPGLPLRSGGAEARPARAGRAY